LSKTLTFLCHIFLTWIWFTSPTWADEKNVRSQYPNKPEIFFPELSAVLSELVKKAPFLEEQRELVIQAQSGKIISESSKGFKVGINAQAQSLHEDRPSQGFYHRYRVLGSIYLRRPLYHWGALDAASRVAELSERNAKIQYASLQRSYESKTRSDFLDLVILHYEEDLARASYALAQKNELDLMRRRDLGLVSDLTVYESTLSRLKQAIKLSDIRRKANYQGRVFHLETGYPKGLTFAKTPQFTDFCEKHVFSGSPPILVSRLSSPELENLRNEIEKENNQIKIADAELKPKIDLIGGLYQDQVDLANSNESLNRNNLIIGVEAKWNIWDSSLSKGKKEAARSKKRMNELSLQRNSKSLRLLVEDLHNQIASLSGKIEVNRQLVKVADNRYEKSVLEFKQNRITPTLHFEARLTLDESKLDLAKTVSHYLKVRDLYDERTNFNKN
jgi:outer membrane protein TolC